MGIISAMYEICMLIFCVTCFVNSKADDKPLAQQIPDLFNKINDEASNMTVNNSKSTGDDIEQLMKLKKQEEVETLQKPLDEVKNELNHSGVVETLEAAKQGKPVSSESISKFLEIARVVQLYANMVGDHLEVKKLQSNAKELKKAIEELESNSGNQSELIKRIADQTKAAKKNLEMASKDLYRSLEDEGKKLKEKAEPSKKEGAFIKKLIVQAKQLYYFIRGQVADLLGTNNPS